MAKSDKSQNEPIGWLGRSLAALYRVRPHERALDRIAQVSENIAARDVTLAEAVKALSEKVH